MRNRPRTRFQSLAAKFALAILSPFLFFGFLEGLFLLAHIGYPTRFFVPDTINGQAVYRDNPFVTYRVFPPALARSPSPTVVARHKPPDVFRVVVLGESAAQGDPAPEFGVSRLLEPMLQSALATGRVEVINAATVAINSHVITEIARDLPRLQPDWVVLYVGNNEVIGPYGPGTVFTRFFEADWLPGLAMRLGRTRLMQVIRMMIALAGDRRSPRTFGGVEMVANNAVSRDDPRLQRLHHRYRRNICQLITQAQAAGARVLVSSVAVNLSDCPPSISRNRPFADDNDRVEWHRLHAHGRVAYASHNWAQALDVFQQMAVRDPGHAETQYLAGQCLDHLGRHDEARAHFQLACDLDALRYRTDSSLKAILHDCAHIYSNAVWIDAADAFQRFSDASDADLFVDHVHFTFTGTHRLSRLWAAAITQSEMASGRFLAHASFPTEIELRTQLLFTPLAELAQIQPMIARFQRPPFDQQLDRDARLEKLRTLANTLLQEVRKTDLNELHNQFERVFYDHPGDPYWTKQWGQWLLIFQRYTDVEPAMDDAMRRYPHIMIHRSLAAQALAALGKIEAAAAMLVGWQKKQGFFVAAEIGPQIASLAADGRLPEAVDFARRVEALTRHVDYRHRVRLEADKAESAHRAIEQAKRLIQQGRDPQAAVLLQRANQTTRCPEPAYWLGGIAARRRENPMPFLRQAFQIWSPPRSAYHAGLWRALSRVPQDARTYFEEAAQGAGDDFELIRSLAWVWLAHPVKSVRSPDDAVRLAPALARGSACSPEHLRLAETLAWVLAADGQWERATQTVTHALLQMDSQTSPQMAKSLHDTLQYFSRQAVPTAWPSHQIPMNFF